MSDPLVDEFNAEVDDALSLLKFQQSEPATIGWSVKISPRTERK